MNCSFGKSKNWVHRIRRSDNNENLKDLIVQILNKIGTLYIPNLITYFIEKTVSQLGVQIEQTINSFHMAIIGHLS